MERSEILRRAGADVSLFSASDEELEGALEATRNAPKYMGQAGIVYGLEQELASRRKWRNKRRKGGTVSGVTHVRRKGRCPTKRALSGRARLGR